MQAVILAAGLGSRLGALTVSTPKAMIEVAGRPLVDYALAFVARAGFERVVVVRGYGGDEVEARVRAQAPHALVVDNPDYRKGNALSFRAALAELRPDDGYLVMNTDHVYRPTIADLVATRVAAAESVIAFCDHDRTLGPDDMKVELERDRVHRMAKTLARWDCGYVGMTFVPRAHASAHREAIAAVIADRGESVHVEAALVELAGRGLAPAIADISGHGWLEIDEPHERDRAEAVLARERWWS